MSTTIYIFVAPALAWHDIGIRLFVHSSIRPFVLQSVNICVNPNFDPNVQFHFPRTINASVMILGIACT